MGKKEEEEEEGEKEKNKNKKRFSIRNWRDKIKKCTIFLTKHVTDQSHEGRLQGFRDSRYRYVIAVKLPLSVSHYVTVCTSLQGTLTMV